MPDQFIALDVSINVSRMFIAECTQMEESVTLLYASTRTSKILWVELKLMNLNLTPYEFNQLRRGKYEYK